MKQYDDIYTWNGWGGKFRLADGSCQLCVFHFDPDKKEKIKRLKQTIVITQDILKKKRSFGEMSIRSCAGHIATSVTKEFNINPNRMLWVEYYPETTYGARGEKVISEDFFLTDFEWSQGRAMKPKRRKPNPGLIEQIKKILNEESQ